MSKVKALRIKMKLENGYILEEGIRQILEAELTAVKGVDEQPNRKGRPLNDTTAEYWYKKGWNESKEQTPVASECKHGPLQQCKECEKLLPPCPDCGAIGLHGCVGKRPHGLTDIPPVKYSQPKEVKPIYDAKDPESNRKHIIENMC